MQQSPLPHPLPPSGDDVQHAICRIIDGEESPHEWRRFIAVADSVPAIWRELAMGQREARLMADAVIAELEPVASSASGSALAVVGAADLRPAASVTSRRRVHPFATGAGWALAACVAGAWVVSAGIAPRQAPSTTASTPDIQQAAFVRPDQALDAYLELGRQSGAVVGELPGKPIIERRPLENGEGFEIVYVRQIVERSRVPALWSFDQSDEFGTPVAAPVRRRSGGSL